MMILAGIGTALSSAGSAIGGTLSGGIGAGGTLATILQGTATVLGVMAALDAGRAEETNFALKADETERERALETLQGIERRSSIKKALRETQGAIDTSYASSGLDLSFGTAAQAKQDAYRDADYAMTMDAGTEMTRGSRLQERAASYRAASKRARKSGRLDAWTRGLTGAASILDRY